MVNVKQGLKNIINYIKWMKSETLCVWISVEILGKKHETFKHIAIINDRWTKEQRRRDHANRLILYWLRVSVETLWKENETH